jgi:uncharacterized membrane protein HdeD (DUF308 family)
MTRLEAQMAQTPIGRAVHGVWWVLIIRGLLAVTIGILILARPMESVAAFALVIALWALMQGIVTVAHAFELRSIAPHWWILLLSGFISAAFGIAALYYYPGLSLAFAVVWTAWWLMLGGIAGLSVAMMERRAGMAWGWTFAWGILGVIAAIVAFASPPATLAALLGIISVFAIITGVLLLGAAYRLRSVVDVTIAENQ